MPDPKPGEPGYVDPALKTEPLKPGDEGYIEPKKEPPEGLPKKDEPLKADDPLAQQLPDVEGIPDKLKGKTVKEALEMLGGTQGELTKALTEISQWRKFAEEEELRKAGETKEEEYNPLDHLDEDQARAVTTIVSNQMKPLTNAMDGMMLEKVEQTRPDFGEYKERTLKIFQEMPFQHKYHPAYGIDFAYRFAKAEKEGGPPPAGPGPPAMGPSNTGGDITPKEGALTKAELHIAEKMDMTPEDYKKHKDEQSPTVEMEVSGKPKE